MDLQKEREAFEQWAYSNKWNIFRVRDMGLDHYVDDFVNGAWHGWQARAQSVQEGFVLVPKEPTQEMIDAGVSESDVDWKRLRFAYIAMIEAQEPK